MSSLRILLSLACGLLTLYLGAQELQIVGPYGDTLPFASVALWPEPKYLGSADANGRFPLEGEFTDEQLFEFNFVGFAEEILSYAELRERNFVVTFSSPTPSISYLTVVGRRSTVVDEQPAQVTLIGRTEMDRVQPLTTVDALAEVGGVYVQKSQFGGGSPVLRGFEANRVLLVVDGVRMNNAIYRNGHLQNAITVDPLALARMEVIYGSGALAYGSDAIGGVIYFRTRTPGFYTPAGPDIRTDKATGEQVWARPRDARWAGAANVGYSSAAKARTAGVRLEYGRPNFASLTLLSTTSTSHLRAGAQRPAEFPSFGRRPEFVERVNGQDVLRQNDNPDVQVGTAYAQYNLLQKFRFRLHDRLELTANLQYSTTSAVPRYDALTERQNGRPRWAEWDYGPQTRALAAVRLNDQKRNRLYDVASYLISHQLIAEDRLQRRFGDPLREENLVDVGATNLQLDFTKDLRSFTLRYGLDLRYDRVRSQAQLRNVDGGRISPEPVNSRYPSAGSSLAGAGAYLEGSRLLAPAWRLRGGLRYSRQRLTARFSSNDPIAWPNAYLAGVSNTESAVTTALGLVYDDGDRHRWRMLLAQGFRAPNIDDFGKFREQNGFVLLPNPTLRPERSLTLETGYRWRSPDRKVSLEGTVYHTWLTKAIIRRDGTLPNGERSFVSRGDTLFVQTNVNAEAARVYGLDLRAEWQPTSAWRLKTSLHYLRGQRDQLAPDGTTLRLPQDHIPPPYGSSTLSWQHQRWDLSGRLRYQLAKRPEDYAVGEIQGTTATGYMLNRTGTADNFELTPVDREGTFVGTYGWWTANLALSYEATDALTLRLKADNLLDRHYRTFASGVSAPGRDIGVAATVKW